jgi:hypothetical protein
VFEPETEPRDLRPVWESFRKWFLPAPESDKADEPARAVAARRR